MGHLLIQRVLRVGHLISFLELGTANLTAKNRKIQIPGDCPGGRGLRLQIDKCISFRTFCAATPNSSTKTWLAALKVANSSDRAQKICQRYFYPEEYTNHDWILVTSLVLVFVYLFTGNQENMSSYSLGEIHGIYPQFYSMPKHF